MGHHVSRFRGNDAWEQENRNVYAKLIEDGNIKEAEWFAKFNLEWDSQLKDEEYELLEPSEGKARKEATVKSVSSYYSRKIPLSGQETNPIMDIIDEIDKKYYLSKQKQDVELKDIPPVLEFISEMPGVTYIDDEDLWQSKRVGLDKNGLLMTKHKTQHISREHAEIRMGRVNRFCGTEIKDLNRHAFELEWNQEERAPSKSKISGGMQRTKEINKFDDNAEYFQEKTQERLADCGPKGRVNCKEWVEDENQLDRWKWVW